MLTQSELKSQLSYNEETGIFTWLVSNSNRVKVNQDAGYKRTSGYVVIRVNSKEYQAHRLAFLYIYGEFPVKDIDHINGIRYDNRIINLRNATMSQNMFNVGIQKNNTSGFKGVSFAKCNNKWQTQAKLKSKKYHLGYFITPELASEAYQTFAKKHHGEFFHE